jgi:hypothetical protein
MVEHIILHDFGGFNADGIRVPPNVERKERHEQDSMGSRAVPFEAYPRNAMIETNIACLFAPLISRT